MRLLKAYTHNRARSLPPLRGRAELIAQTWEWVRSSPSLRELYDREQHDRQRKLERNSKHLHSAKSAAAQGVSLCESQTQNTHSGSER